MEQNIGTVFLRSEKKYLISEEAAEKLFNMLFPYLEEDPYGAGEVCSLYFDAPDFRIIRHSVERPDYKAKIRLRSYGVPVPGTMVYLEMKEKLGDTVYKRREPMTLEAAHAYVEKNVMPSNTQIMREIDWARHSSGFLMPMIYIAYHRSAYMAKTNPDLRITFDRNIIFRRDDLFLEDGIRGERLLKSGVIVEIKDGNAMPLWLTSALSATGSLPITFSKYGEVYKKHIITEAQYA